MSESEEVAITKSIIVINRIVSFRTEDSFDYGTSCGIGILVDTGQWLHYDFYDNAQALGFFNSIREGIIDGKYCIEYVVGLEK